MKFDIITIGSATRDVFLTSRDFKVIPSKKFKTGYGECFAFGSKIELGDIFLDTGGGATNAAVTFANLGLKTACISKVGDDTDADVIVNDLANRGVSTELLIRSRKEKTGHSVIIVTPDGHRTILVYRGASSTLEISEIPWKHLRATWFYVTSLAGNISLYKKILDHAQKIGAHVAWNPGGGELKRGLEILKPLIARTNIFNVNDEEASNLTGSDMKSLKDILYKLKVIGSNIIVVTCGRKGAYIANDDSAWFIKPRGVKLVNATGAGDAFGSGFVAGLATSHDLITSARIAMFNAEGVITKVGAKNGLIKYIPSKKVLEKVRVKKL